MNQTRHSGKGSKGVAQRQGRDSNASGHPTRKRNPADPGDTAKQGSAVAWLAPFALLVLAIVAVPLRVLDERGLPRYRILKAELAHVERQNIKLSDALHGLKAEVYGLRHDPAAIERIARDELGMVRQGELVFQFPR